MFLSPEDIKKVTDSKGINLEEEGNRFVYLFERENGQKAFYAFMMIISVILVNLKLRLP